VALLKNTISFHKSNTAAKFLSTFTLSYFNYIYIYIYIYREREREREREFNLDRTSDIKWKDPKEHH
jgi:hypothetical protein